MHLSHTLLSLGAAAACWTVAGISYEVPRSSMGNVEPHNPLAICRSAYGSLIARLMKDSLESYWHGGSTHPPHKHASAPAGVAKHDPDDDDDHDDDHDHDHPPVPASTKVASSWIDRCGRRVSEMEHMRSVRNSPFAVAPNHRLFLSASADWRVHIAWELDPGDAALYEVDSFVSVSRATSPDVAKRKTDELAQRTIQHALSPQAGPVDALTGAGAVINLLNDELRHDRPEPPKIAELQRHWRVLTFCLQRHRELREEAVEEDWWNDIPEVRRGEIETYARMLERLSVTIHKQLAANGMISQ